MSRSKLALVLFVACLSMNLLPVMAATCEGAFTATLPPQPIYGLFDGWQRSDLYVGSESTLSGKVVLLSVSEIPQQSTIPITLLRTEILCLGLKNKLRLWQPSP